MSFIPFGVSLVLSAALVPAVRWLSFRTGRVSYPRKDRWHRKPTPALGGVAMFLAFAATVLSALVLPGAGDVFQKRWGLLLATTLMFGLGLYDDFKRIAPPHKLAGQLIAATILIFFGESTIDFFPWPIANIILTYFWLIGITNAINLLDNMDGLAAGVSLIAAGVLSFFFWRGEYPDLLWLSLPLTGALLGFLVFNFPPAKIFMGDSGSMFLGFSLAALSIARRTSASNVFAVVGVPTLLFLLPIFDTTLVTLTRLMRGQSPMQGGTDHTSHRLIAFGLSERQAVLVLYAIALISGVAAAGLEALDYDLSLVFIPLLLISLALFTAYLGRLRVVSTANAQPGAIARLVANLTYKRRLFEILLDLMLIAVSYYLAFWTRFGLDMTPASMALYQQSWPVALGLAYLAYFIFGIYRGVWRYIGLTDLLRYIGAVIIAGASTWLIIRWLLGSSAYSPDIFLLYIVYLLLGLAGSRLSFQFLDRIYHRQQIKASPVGVILYGAEDAGEMALRWMLRNPDMGYNPLGYIDDDAYKWGSLIHNVPVIGGGEKLIELLNNGDVEGVIFTAETMAETEIGKEILSTCRQKGIWVRVLKLEFELLEE